jgi:hypothetical protein
MHVKLYHKGETKWVWRRILKKCKRE